MDEKPDQILNHIEAQRDELGRNLNELETRVKETTDWRTYFDRNPMMMLGAALGGGVLLGSIVGGTASKKGRRSRMRGAYSTPSNYSSENFTGLGLASSVGYATAGVGDSPDVSSQSAQHSGPSRRSKLKSSESMQQVSQTVDQVKAALIAFGIAKAKEFLCEAIPGFDQHMQQATQKHGSGSGTHEHTHRHGNMEHSHEHSHAGGSSHDHSHEGSSMGAYADRGSRGSADTGLGAISQQNEWGTGTGSATFGESPESTESTREPVIVTP